MSSRIPILVAEATDQLGEHQTRVPQVPSLIPSTVYTEVVLWFLAHM